MGFPTQSLVVVTFSLAICSILARDKIAGYEPDTDVTEHAEIDLDQRDMESFCDKFQWAEASTIYSSGKHSEKSDSKRTLKGFSSDAPGKLDGEPFFELFKKYWSGSATYADEFVTDALKGVGAFQGKDGKFRSECANKGSQYQNVHMYVIHEMEDAINDCYEGDLNDNDKGVTAWDEAWAFWVGSIIDENGGNAENGKLGYTLAHKRAGDYGTSNKDGKAKVNEKMLDLMKQGKEELDKRNCGNVIEIKNKIVRQMYIPVIQGIIRYVEQTSGEQSSQEELDKRHGEGWAFSAAVLPFIDHCDGSVASKLRKNFEPSANPPMSDSVSDVIGSLQSVYGCLGIGCDEVDTTGTGGTCTTRGSLKPVPGEDKSSKGESGNPGKGLSGGAIAGIVIGVLVVLAVVAFLFLRNRGKKMTTLPMTGAGSTFPEA